MNDSSIMLKAETKKLKQCETQCTYISHEVILLDVLIEL